MERVSSRIKINVESLSDLIFGLALSIGSIFLLGNSSTNRWTVLSNLVAFGFSFLILVIIWARYKRTVSVLHVETGLILELNIAMLFLVAIEPYLFNLLLSGASLSNFSFSNPPPEITDFTSQLYAIDIGSIYLILGTLTYAVIRNQGLNRTEALHPTLLRSLKQSMHAQLTESLLFLISAFPVFWTYHILPGVPIRLSFWGLSFIASSISRIVGIALQKSGQLKS
jgi:uncharacterized membrane protein